MEEGKCEYYYMFEYSYNSEEFLTTGTLERAVKENKPLASGQITTREVHSCGNRERLREYGYTRTIASVCKGVLTKCLLLNK